MCIALTFYSDIVTKKIFFQDMLSPISFHKSNNKLISRSKQFAQPSKLKYSQF